MLNRSSPKEYGKHGYIIRDGVSDCKYKCGCWVRPTYSNGPPGLDPFGCCPKNPIDGNLLGGNKDYESVIASRIRDLETCLHKAENCLKESEKRLKEVDPEKLALVAKLKSAKAALSEYEKLISEMIKLIDGVDYLITSL